MPYHNLHSQTTGMQRNNVINMDIFSNNYTATTANAAAAKFANETFVLLDSNITNGKDHMYEQGNMNMNMNMNMNANGNCGVVCGEDQ